MPPPEKKCLVFTKPFKTDFTVYLKRVFFVVVGWFYFLNIDFKKNKVILNLNRCCQIFFFFFRNGAIAKYTTE